MPWGNYEASAEKARASHTDVILTLEGVDSGLTIYESRLNLDADTTPFDRDVAYFKEAEDWLTKPEEGAARLHFHSVMGHVVDVAERPPDTTAEAYVDDVTAGVRATLSDLRSGIAVEEERLKSSQQFIRGLLSYFRSHPTTGAAIESGMDAWKRQQQIDEIKRQRDRIDTVDKRVIFDLGKRIAKAAEPLTESERMERLEFAAEVGLDSELANELLDFLDSTSGQPLYQRAIAKLVQKAIAFVPGHQRRHQAKLLRLDSSIIQNYAPRLGYAVAVGRSKAQLGAAVEDGLREQEMAEMQAGWGQEARVVNDVLKRYRQLCFKQSKQIQRPLVEGEAA